MTWPVEDMPLPVVAMSQAETAGEVPCAALAFAVGDPLATAAVFVDPVRDLSAVPTMPRPGKRLAPVCHHVDMLDLDDARDLVGDLGLSTSIQESTERPEQIAYEKLLDVGGQGVRFFGGVTLPGTVMLTMVRPDSEDS